jgi:hypothetical protein
MKQKLWRLIHLWFLIIGAATLAAAQTSGSAVANGSPPVEAAQSSHRTSADENFELNITERRIVERNFEASTSVEAGEETARGLMLRVGVAVGADEINVLLRNVRGHVRFRASLERVLERLNVRRTPDAGP